MTKKIRLHSKKKADDSFWAVPREWMARVSKWKLWKKVALGFAIIFIYFISFLLMTSTQQETNKLKSR